MRKFTKKIVGVLLPVLFIGVLAIPGSAIAQTPSGIRTAAGFSLGSTGVDVPVNGGIGYLVAAALILGATQLYYRNLKNKTANNVAA